MLTAEERSRVSVVLVRARNPNNIGAVARAMHNFGFTDLRLVNDYSLTLEKARSAVDASAILDHPQRVFHGFDASGQQPTLGRQSPQERYARASPRGSRRRSPLSEPRVQLRSTRLRAMRSSEQYSSATY